MTIVGSYSCYSNHYHIDNCFFTNDSILIQDTSVDSSWEKSSLDHFLMVWTIANPKIWASFNQTETPWIWCVLSLDNNLWVSQSWWWSVSYLKWEETYSIIWYYPNLVSFDLLSLFSVLLLFQSSKMSSNMWADPHSSSPSAGVKKITKFFSEVSIPMVFGQTAI